MINKTFSLSQNVRYVAIYRAGKLETRSKEGTVYDSGSESDRYEELLVNPTLLTLAVHAGLTPSLIWAGASRRPQRSWTRR